jgi:protein SCO1/2/putative membrane protein
VSRPTRLGIQIVLGTILVAAFGSLALVARTSAPAGRAAQDLGPGALPVGSFQLQERSGQTVTQADLDDRVWIAAFIFTRCPLSCPRISSAMKGLQSRLAKTNVLLVSISVDPEHDTPPVLSAYAQRFGAVPQRWWFLTGTKSAIYDLVRERFKLALRETPPADRSAGFEVISHSSRLALVDRGQIVGFFESDDEQSLDALVARARRRALPRWVRVLPAVNASLNGLCAALLLAGWTFIRHRYSIDLGDPITTASPFPKPALLHSRAVRAHATCMLLAVAASTLFLVTYLVYHGRAGSVAFPHGGSLRVVYYTILISHTLLATFGVIPLVIVTLTRALRRDFTRHARVAQVTFPIWLYVSVTGVVIYVMLYQPLMLASTTASM